MPLITVSGRTIQASSTIPLLDTLLAHGVQVPFSCRSGYCHSCLMKTDKGSPPPKSQASLSQDSIKQGHFLACQCLPEEDMTVSPARRTVIPAIITARASLTPTLLSLDILPKYPLPYEPGQYVMLYANTEGSGDELTRPCYIASVAEQDQAITVHIRRRVGGSFSHWVYDCTQIGHKMSISDSRGDSLFHVLTSNTLIVVQDGCLAPVLSLLRALVLRKDTVPRRLHVLLQADQSDNLYGIDVIEQIRSQLPGLEYRLFSGSDGQKELWQYLKTLTFQDTTVQSHIKGSESLSDQHVIISGYREFIEEGTKYVRGNISPLPYS